MQRLLGICNHVIAPGGGTLENDESLRILQSLGILVWIDTEPKTIAWRLLQEEQELKNRPHLSDGCLEGEMVHRFENLKQRLEALREKRRLRYALAELVFYDDQSTPELCAYKIINMLVDRCGSPII